MSVIATMLLQRLTTAVHQRATLQRLTVCALIWLLLGPMLAGDISLSPMSSAHADSITLQGSSIPLRNLTIEGIQSGQVFYRDASGARQRRSLNEVTALGFDELPQIEAGERAWLQGDRDQAIARLLDAFVQAERDLHRLWLHRRLAQMHDERSEFVQSVSHAAAALTIDPSLFWRPLLQPVTRPAQQSQPPYAAAREAQDRLLMARNIARDATLTAIVDERLQEVRAIVQQLEQAAGLRPSYQSNTTISGVRIEDIRQGRYPGLLTPADEPDDDADDVNADDNVNSDADADTDTDPLTPPVQAAPPPPGDASDAAEQPITARPLAMAESPAPAITGPTAPDRIEALLADGMYAPALELCRRVADQPGDRALDRFLIQFGRALAGTGQPRDAAVMFTRAAVLYPTSPHSVDGLIETALIYRRTFNQPATARRLLDLAEQRAASLDLPDQVSRVQELRQQLPESSP